ncbi:hypothetical protein GCM10009416_11770 [Craurococcus roseus]|uniref:Uncharacterized protein n=1 Tax=Craurococcus roseus TaxID=77585 RepID=A0ABN1EVI3_9PROT
MRDKADHATFEPAKRRNAAADAFGTFTYGMVPTLAGTALTHRPDTPLFPGKGTTAIAP